MDVPPDPSDATQLAESLMNFGVSLMQYKAAAESPEVTM